MQAALAQQIAETQRKLERLKNPFASFHDPQTPQTSEEINILVIGETGVGKSTWINGIANYMSFERFEDALKTKQLPCLIPMNFNLYTGDNYNEVNVKVKATVKSEILRRFWT